MNDLIIGIIIYWWATMTVFMLYYTDNMYAWDKDPMIKIVLWSLLWPFVLPMAVLVWFYEEKMRK